MEINIIVNKKIYLTYKKECLELTPRLFDEPYFYSIKDYKDPIDLVGISDYILFTDKVNIFATSSFIDFINILLVLNFLNKNNYRNKVVISYFLLFKKDFDKSIYSKATLESKDYENIFTLIEDIKEFKKTNVEIDKLLGYKNYINFYNLLTNKELFINLLEDDIDDLDDKEEIASVMEEKYSQFELDKEFYLNYLNRL